ncbi:MAG TPA: DUF1761 domain-containing protein [archaeon]|nr:DUF1761 domain-containing protein [archaeon]
MVFFDVNYTAVVAASVASMIIGFIWFHPSVMGTKWVKLSGMKVAGKKKEGMGQMMLLAFIATLVSAYVLAYVVQLWGAATYVEGATAGFWVWLGFVATTQYGAVLWEKKSNELFLLNAAHQLVSFAVMGAILAAWL